MAEPLFQDSRPVLIVQDVSGIGKEIQKALEKVGYTNTQVVTSTKAARLYLENLGKPAFAVIADLGMLDAEQNILLQIKENPSKYGTPYRAGCSGSFLSWRASDNRRSLNTYGIEIGICPGDDQRYMEIADWLLAHSYRDPDPNNISQDLATPDSKWRGQLEGGGQSGGGSLPVM